VKYQVQGLAGQRLAAGEVERPPCSVLMGDAGVSLQLSEGDTDVAGT
jgi:hypothetical protein